MSQTPAAPPFAEHSQRRALTDELHARPFLPITAPARILTFAILPEESSGELDAALAYGHLRRLLTRAGWVSEGTSGGELPALGPDDAPPRYLLHPIEAGPHGPASLRWERHTEFVSYSLILTERRDMPLFDADLLGLLPPDWLETESGAPLGAVISASLMEILPAESTGAAERVMGEQVEPLLDPESTALSWLSGETAMAASDFRIDANGLTRFALVATPEIGPRRLGRAAQRLIEIDAYRALSMLALPVARRLMARLGEIEAELVEVAGEIAEADGASAEARAESERATLARLTALAADLERRLAETAFRFGAARAYQALVHERLEAIRETRIGGRATFRELMTRRYTPSMRTAQSASDRIAQLSARAERAANLLRTRVDVALQAQNQAVLHSMDRRARLQLRLQQTVEGLSVVAISYYAVSLAGYVLAPFGKTIGLDEKWLKAIVALPIIALVWLLIRRIRERVEKGEDKKDDRGDERSRE